MEPFLGQVAWFSDKRDCEPPAASETGEHPCVITHIFTKDGKQWVHIRMTTSLGGLSLVEKRMPWQWKYYFLAQDSETTVLPEDGNQVVKMSGGKWKKKTWINLSPGSRYTVEYSKLDTARPDLQALRFDAAAVRTLVREYRAFTPL